MTGNSKENQQYQDEKSSLAIDAVAGFVAGICQVAIGQPFDIIKLKQQLQISPCKESKSLLGPISCFKGILRTEGPLAFYKGAFFPLITSGLANSCIFSGFQVGKRFSDTLGIQNETLQLLLAGSIAGVCFTPMYTLLEFSKLKMQMQVKTGLANTTTDRVQFTGSFNVIAKTFKEFGFRGIFKGTDAMLVRNIITFALYFTQYESICGVLQRYSGIDTGSRSLFHSALAGGIVGSFNWALTYPLDTFKSVSQTDCPKNPKYPNYFSLVKRVVLDKGIRGIYSGLTITMIRGFPVNAAIFSSHQMTKDYLQKQNFLKF